MRLTQIDGELPNIALMKLAHWHRAQGDDVYLTKSVEPDMFEPSPDIIYGSTIFDFSRDLVSRFRKAFPTAFVSGTGTAKDGGPTVEKMIGVDLWDYEQYDYSDYPEFRESIGFTQRGCRLNCKFCGVRAKEGKPVSVNAIEAIWRGDPYPRKLHLLDNDFFGQLDWREKIAAIRDGGFKVCMSQGVNIRLINDESAAALASIEYRDTKFRERRLYTAWDNIGDEAVFFRGVDTLERAGVPPKHLMAYMLIGFDRAETWERIWHRFSRMIERGIMPYPMVYDRSRKDLKCFQRWVITGMYRFLPWGEYESAAKSAESVESFPAGTPATNMQSATGSQQNVSPNESNAEQKDATA